MRVEQLRALEVQPLGVDPRLGGSSATIPRIWSRWVTTMSRNAPGLLVETGPALDVELLGDVDLDVGDVVAVPHGLEDPVGEAQRQDVLRRLLAQEVVDPVDRLLVQDLVQGRVELLGAGLVVAEGLLHHQRAVLRDPADAQHPHHVLHRARRHRQVDEPLALGADLRLGVGDRLGQLGAVLGAGGDEAQARREVVPVLVELAPAVLLKRLVDLPGESRRLSPASGDPSR